MFVLLNVFAHLGLVLQFIDGKHHEIFVAQLVARPSASPASRTCRACTRSPKIHQHDLPLYIAPGCAPCHGDPSAKTRGGHAGGWWSRPIAKGRTGQRRQSRAVTINFLVRPQVIFIDARQPVVE